MSRTPRPELSVVTPAHNEEHNVGPLVEQIEAALSGLDTDFEIVVVDDGSTDRTAEKLEQCRQAHPRLRVIRMLETPAGSGHGQSAAFHAGFRAARGGWIVSMDADLQNDPADIGALIAAQRKSGADMVQGDRSALRQDGRWRQFVSWVGRAFRHRLLGDTIRDTGCSLRLMRRAIALELPLQYRGMHRFIPGTARQLGYSVIELPVSHRPRIAGSTKYGTWDRARVGLSDCIAVRWMVRRRRPVAAEEASARSDDVRRPA